MRILSHNKFLQLSIVAFTVVFLGGCKGDGKHIEGSVTPEFYRSVDGTDLQDEDLLRIIDQKYLVDDLRSDNKSGISLESDVTEVVGVVDSVPTDRSGLEKMRLIQKIYKGKESAGISVPGFGGIKLGKKETSLSAYYIEVKIVEQEDDTLIYGCGYSVHYLFKKIKRGLQVADLPSVSASVHLEDNKTQVFYSLQTYGLHGVNLVKFFRPTLNEKFDVDGFGTMQSSLDGIHNILGDSVLSSSIKFTPELLKFVSVEDLTSPF